MIFLYYPLKCIECLVNFVIQCLQNVVIIIEPSYFSRRPCTQMKGKGNHSHDHVLWGCWNCASQAKKRKWKLILSVANLPPTREQRISCLRYGRMAKLVGDEWYNDFTIVAKFYYCEGDKILRKKGTTELYFIQTRFYEHENLIRFQWRCWETLEHSWGYVVCVLTRYVMKHGAL